MKKIRFCSIGGGHGGPTLDCTQSQDITDIEAAEFILNYSKSSIMDEMFRVYEFNSLGMMYIERLGYCHNWGCDIKHFQIYEPRVSSLFTIEDFTSGTYPNKLFKEVVK